MSLWPEDGERIIEAYIAGLNLRGPLNPIYYRQALRNFLAVVSENGITDRAALVRWVRERDARWARSTLRHRIGIVNRFLDTLAARALIARNPFAELRVAYHVRGCRRIGDALLASDPDGALEALRCPAPFASVLGEAMRGHFALMRSRGYRYETQTAICLRFDMFLQGRTDLATEPLEVMLRNWATARTTPNHLAECEKLARILDRARRHGDPSTARRRADSRAIRQVEAGWRRPYIYSVDKIWRLLDIAATYPSPGAPSRPVNLQAMLVLLYCAGVRVGELARLTLDDVDLQARTLAIRETKFLKSRLLPLSDSAIAALGDLLVARVRAGLPDDPAAPLFWHDGRSRGYARATIADMLVGVLRRAGIKPERGKTGPRIHDLRHTFVVHRVLDWYREGVDAQKRLSYLAAYLGHRDINSTLVYITIARELPHEASERFRSHCAPCLSALGEARP